MSIDEKIVSTVENSLMRQTGKVLSLLEQSRHLLADLQSAGVMLLWSQGNMQHKKRGSRYNIIGVGNIQTGTPLRDDDVAVVYQCVEDGRFWVRPLAEVVDGRFSLDLKAVGSLSTQAVGSQSTKTDALEEVQQLSAMLGEMHRTELTHLNTIERAIYASSQDHNMRLGEIREVIVRGGGDAEMRETLNRIDVNLTEIIQRQDRRQIPSRPTGQEVLVSAVTTALVVYRWAIFTAMDVMKAVRRAADAS